MPRLYGFDTGFVSQARTCSSRLPAAPTVGHRAAPPNNPDIDRLQSVTSRKINNPTR
jgi:hypothetical protein